jgi:hypothetical protein
MTIMWLVTLAGCAAIALVLPFLGACMVLGYVRWRRDG